MLRPMLPLSSQLGILPAHQHRSVRADTAFTGGSMQVCYKIVLHHAAKLLLCFRAADLPGGGPDVLLPFGQGDCGGQPGRCALRSSTGPRLLTICELLPKPSYLNGTPAPPTCSAENLN